MPITPITTALRAFAAAAPDALALAGREARLTRAELEQDARRLAGRLDDAMRTADDGVAIIRVASSFHAARLVVALEGTAAVFGVIDPHWPTAVQGRMLNTAGASILITDSPDDDLRRSGWGGRTITLRDLDDDDDPPTASAPLLVRDDDAFLLLFSSGTTGIPKSFLKTRAQYRANLAVSRDRLGAAAGVITFAPGPLSYSLTLYALFESLATGGAIHLPDRLDDLWLSSRVADERITRLVTVPTALHPLIEAAGRTPGRFDGLDLIVTGGAGLTDTTRARLMRTLPQAETVAYYGAGELGFIGDSREGDGDGIRLYSHVEAMIRDDDGHPVRDGALGTLWVRSASCSDRYLRAPATGELRDAEGWASVGDQGRLVGRTFTFAGRRGDIVSTGGHKVALGEVEQAFDGMPGIGAACAVAIPDDRLGAVVALVVEGEAEGEVASKRTLQDWGAARLALASMPRRWYTVARLPRTSGGKLRRDAVAELIAAGREARRL